MRENPDHIAAPRRNAVLKALAVLLLASPWAAMAQNDADIPTRGKRFWAGYMRNGVGAQSLRVHIAGAGTATSGTVSIPLTGWSETFTVGANAVAVVNVPLSAEHGGSEVVENKGVLIETVDSVNVMISSSQSWTVDLTQVLPANAIGTSYRVDAYHGTPAFNELHKSQLLIVAAEDGTEVVITPSVNTMGGNPSGVPFTVQLNAGQSYQVRALASAGDLTGTVVQASQASGACRPFAVFGGSSCAMIPTNCSACDMVFTQLIPRTAWGTSFFVPPVHGVNTFTYRVLADQNGTTITIGGGNPITLNAGQSHQVNGQTTAVCIAASAPVSVTQMLEGTLCSGNGDPSMTVVWPASRLSRSAVFQAQNGAQINAHSVSIVAPAAAVGTITLNGNPVAANLFQPFAGCSGRVHARVPLGAGTHRLSSSVGFQAYMYGLGSGESYASAVHDLRSTPVQQDSVVCGAGSITLNAPEPWLNTQWTLGGAPNTVVGTGNSITVSPTSSTTYVVSGLQPVSGCPRSFTFNVGLPLTIPTYVTANAASSATVCQYAQVQLGLDPPPDPDWFTIQWSPVSSLNDPTVANPVATPTSTTWYSVQITSPAGCGDMTDSVLVNVEPGQVADLSTTASPSTICLGDSVQLTSRALRVAMHERFNGPPGTLWTAIQGGSVSAACGSVDGTALYFNGNGQRWAQTVAFNTTAGGRVRFHLKIANGTGAPCDDADPGEDVVLEYSTNNGISWTLMATFPENAYPVFTAVDLVLPGAAQAANTMLRVRQIAHSGAGHDNWALDEFMVLRVDNTYLAYQWQPGTVANASAANTMGYPTGSGWYTLLGTDPQAGCVYRDSVFVQVDPAFSLSVTPDTTLCAAAGVQLQAVPSFVTPITWSWSPNNGTLSASNTATPVATPQQTTTYAVLATTENGCTASGAVTVTVGQLLDLQVGATSTTLCQGQSTTLNALAVGAPGLQFNWTNGASLSSSTTANPVATPQQTTTYTCTVTDPASGCSLQGSVTITVSTGYTANAGADLTLCTTLGHQLGVQHNVPNATFAWSPAANLNAANIQSPTILVDASATYTVTITDANGCSVSDQVVITRAFSGLPATQSASACMGSGLTITAPQAGVSYLWSTGAQTPSITPPASGAYTLTITDAQGCTGTTTFNVTLFPLPTVSLGPDQSICDAGPVTLNAGNPGSSYAWSTGASTQSIAVSSSGNYGVTVTSANGCAASGSVNVQFNTPPMDVLQDVSACISDPPVLNAGNPGAAYQWSTGATTQTIQAQASGTYTVQVTTPQGCTGTFNAVVFLAPLVFVDLGSDIALCQGETTLLDAGNPGATHVWNTGVTAQAIVVSTTGTYSVTVDNGFCTAQDEVSVTVHPTPVNTLQNATTCIGDTVVLDAGNPGSTFAWSTGGSAQTLQTVQPGVYSVLITNAAGCQATYSATVQTVAPPVVDLGMDTVLCAGSSLMLDAGNPGATYLWSTGATTRTLAISANGTYSVVVDNGYCQRRDSLTALFNPSPSRMAQRKVFTCLDEEPRRVTLDAGNPGARYVWSTGSRQQTTIATAYGWYFVDITNVYDCDLRDSVLVSEYCPSTIYVPNTFTPNGDGVNDVFIPVGKNIATMELTIFDRWGRLVFQSLDPTVGWDGTVQGSPAETEVYLWQLRYRFFEDEHGKIGFEQQRQGHVQVLR
jgi:gliding motility-associated-like protein